MSEDIPLEDFFVIGTPYEINRKRVKELFWLANQNNQVYCEEHEDIYITKQDSLINVVAYLHCGNRMYNIGYEENVSDFILYIKDLCKTKSWEGYKISLIVDFHLRRLAPEFIAELPKDIKYYFLEFRYLVATPPRNPIEQNLDYEMSESKDSRRIVRGPSILYEDPNSERSIMRDIEEGRGDLHGL